MCIRDRFENVCYSPLFEAFLEKVPFLETHYNLSEAPNGLKWGFLCVFIIGGTDFSIRKFVFFAFFEAKMTKNDIPNQKLIDPNEYQPFYIRILRFF